METTAVIGLSAGKRILTSSFCSSDFPNKLSPISDYYSSQYSFSSIKSIIICNNSSHFSSNLSNIRHKIPIKGIEEHADTIAPISRNPWFDRSDLLEDDDPDLECSVEVFILLQKSMLEKQWRLSFNQMRAVAEPREGCKEKSEVISSGISARIRRKTTRRKCLNQNGYMTGIESEKKLLSTSSPQLMDTGRTSYFRGTVSEQLLSHAEVLHLMKKIEAGLFLENQKLKLKERLGFEPSDKQLASSLRITRSELSSKLVDCSLAKEKLAMSNARLVMSIAQKYDNLGAEMADLVQGGLIGLLRGIEKYDSSKGFKITTYVYWWIRQNWSFKRTG